MSMASKSKWVTMRKWASLPLASFSNALKLRWCRSRHKDGADHLQGLGCACQRGEEEQREGEEGPRECEYEFFYVEDLQHNVFGEPVVVKRRKRRRRPAPWPGEPLGNLASSITRDCAEKPEKARSFVLGEVKSLCDSTNSVLEVGTMPGDLSAMAPDTCFRRYSSVGGGKFRMRTGLSAISEDAERTSNDPRAANDSVQEAPAQNMESCHLESSISDLSTLRAIVEQCIRMGKEEEAIDVVTQALIADNALSMSKDLASFCLATLGGLAQTDENKHRMASEGMTLDAIAEAMQIYRGQSSEIHMRACDILQSLSIEEPR